MLPKVRDVTVNLRDRLNDVLISEKYIMQGYRIGSNEVIDQQLYDLVMKNLNGLKQIHRRMFEVLFDLGEYQADTATPSQIADTLQVFNNYKSQLSHQQNIQ